MKPELISMTQWPTMPAPFSSVDGGESWIWGDYLAVMQNRPITIATTMRQMTGAEAIPIAIEYPYAMTVFYQKPKNPYGPSSRPVMVATIEKLNVRAVSQLHGGSTIADDVSTPLVKGIFLAGGRMNLGDFDEILSADTARAYFFEVIGSHLQLPGSPARLGTIKDVFGNSITGWPAVPEKMKKGSGCLAVLALGGVTAFYALFR